MTENEKIIEALNMADVSIQDMTIRISLQFRERIIELLRNQDPAEPEIEGGTSSYWYVCGACHGIVDTRDAYCKHCGRKIKW